MYKYNAPFVDLFYNWFYVRMHLKRSSSAPMINQLGIGAIVPETMNNISPSSTPSSGSLPHHSSARNKESIADLDSYASSFLSSLGGRPRRFSASFSPAVSKTHIMNIHN